MAVCEGEPARIEQRPSGQPLLGGEAALPDTPRLQEGGTQDTTGTATPLLGEEVLVSLQKLGEELKGRRCKPLVSNVLVLAAIGGLVGVCCFAGRRGADASRAAVPADSAARASVMALQARPRATQAGDVEDEAGLESICRADQWRRKVAVCGACKVLVAGFSERPPRLRQLRLSARRSAGEEVAEVQVIGNCEKYCTSIGRGCLGAWRTALRGSCDAVWDFELSCAASLPAGESICQCTPEVFLSTTRGDFRRPWELVKASRPARGAPSASRRSTRHAIAPPFSTATSTTSVTAATTSATATSTTTTGTRTSTHTTTHTVSSTRTTTTTLPRTTAEATARAPARAAHGKAAQSRVPPATAKARRVPATTSTPAPTLGPDNSTHPAVFPCAPFEDGMDFWTRALLSHTGGILSAEECDALCAATVQCGAWSWGKIRNVDGLTDVCFTKLLDTAGSVIRTPKADVISGMKSDCSMQKDVPKPPPLIMGVIKNRRGGCLQAASRGLPGSRVQMWTCIDGDPNQMWVFDAKAGQIRSQDGVCLAAPDMLHDFTPLQMADCDVENWTQQWSWDASTGAIQNWHGLCIDGAEANIDSGEVYMQTCNRDYAEQQWRIGLLSDMPADGVHKAGSKADVSLYCFALMVAGSYEQGLLKRQFELKVSIFQCDEYAVLSNETVRIAPHVVTQVVDSDLGCVKGGEFMTALNLGIFMAVWDKVIADRRFLEHEWTIKVDPDAVFFATRLRVALAVHFETPTGIYLNNCKYGMHGPVEVFSRNAVRSWGRGRHQCIDHFWKLCGGDCLWGEDMFIDQCLWKVLGVQRDNDYRLLVEDHCDPPDNWEDCRDGDKVAFHPFKEAERYMKCLDHASEQKPVRLRLE